MVVLRHVLCFFFFLNDTATTEIYTLSLHDALPILLVQTGEDDGDIGGLRRSRGGVERSEEHTSELQSHSDLVCRLLLEKKTHPEPYPARLNPPRCLYPRSRPLYFI